MASPLSDLDELILRCYDEKARAYISESVASYRAGAFRSAIVGAWIAVCFDFVEKLRELALSGDKEAEKHVEDLEKTRQSGDLAKALKFERELLVLARDKFELISHLEFIDLERLQADRNRCAHPSLISEDQAYAPSAELARLHIHSAVHHVLQHPPVQGKYALDRLMREIESEYFPAKWSDAKAFLQSGPLRKPRESLVNNLTQLLLKILLKDAADWTRRRRIASALRAVSALHPVQYEKTLSAKLSPLVRAVDDSNLFIVIEFFQLTHDTWQYLDTDVRQRMENYVTALPKDHFEEIGFMLGFAPLRSCALSRINSATRAELKDVVFFLFIELPTEVADRLIEIYLETSSFDQANEWAKVLMIHASDFTADHVRRILSSAAKNDQLLHSFELGPLINALRGRKKVPDEEFQTLLNQNGLCQFASKAEQEA